MKKLSKKILAGVLAIFCATHFVPNVTLTTIPEKSVYFGIKITKNWQASILIGVFLGLLIFFIKPILNFFTFPFRIITFGLFSLVLDMAIIWILDVIFPELKIEGFTALLGTTVIVVVFSAIL